MINSSGITIEQNQQKSEENYKKLENRLDLLNTQLTIQGNNNISRARTEEILFAGGSTPGQNISPSCFKKNTKKNRRINNGHLLGCKSSVNIFDRNLFDRNLFYSEDENHPADDSLSQAYEEDERSSYSDNERLPLRHFKTQNFRIPNNGR